MMLVGTGIGAPNTTSAPFNNNGRPGKSVGILIPNHYLEPRIHLSTPDHLPYVLPISENSSIVPPRRAAMLRHGTQMYSPVSPALIPHRKTFTLWPAFLARTQSSTFCSACTSSFPNGA